MKSLELKTLKKYTPDFLITLFLCLLAFFLAEKPAMEISKQAKPQVQEKIPEIKKHKLSTDDIMERNLFTMDGKYTDTLQKPPENPYTLVAVLIAKEKKAVFKDHTGKLFTAKENERMIDGYTITNITENSVILKRGKQKKELTIFTNKKS